MDLILDEERRRIAELLAEGATGWEQQTWLPLCDRAEVGPQQ